MDNVTIGLALVAGILSFISPCVLPLVPAYIGYMGGRLTHNIALQTSAGATSSVSLVVRLQMLLHGVAFVLGFTLIFVLIGLFTTALSSIAGQYVTTFTEILGRLGGLVIIFFGIQFTGLLPKFIAWLRKKGQAGLLDNILLSIAVALLASAIIYWGVVEQTVIALPLIAVLVVVMFINGAFNEPAVFWNKVMDRLVSSLYADTRGDIAGSGREGLLGSAFMGMVFSAGWTPCIGPLLGTILTVAAATGASTGDIAQGMLLLAAYSIGLGIPFIITALLMNSAQGILRRLQRHMGKIELFSGTLLIIIGVLVASGRLQSLSQTFSRGEFSDFTFRVEECGVGFFEGALEFSHVGACLSGSLAPVAINQSAFGEFELGRSEQEYVFHALADQSIDVEVRSVDDDVPEFEVTLFAPGDMAIARAAKADSITEDGKYYPLLALTLDSEGIYRILLRNTSDIDSARFRVKIRDAQPLAAALSDVPPADQPTDNDTETALTDSPVNSFGDILDDLEPVVGLVEGNRAPSFSIDTLAGETVSRADMQGSVVLLNFWGTWCGPCRREMPEFQKAYEEWQASGFEILAIAFNDTEGAMADFRDEFGLTFPLALDATGDINDAYAIQTRPSSYLLDKDGIILARHFGIMTESQLNELLHEALDIQ